MKMLRMLAAMLATAMPASTAAQNAQDEPVGALRPGLGATYFPSFFDGGGALGFQALLRTGPAAGGGAEFAYTYVPSSTSSPDPGMHTIRAMYTLNGRPSAASRLAYGVAVGGSLMRMRDPGYVCPPPPAMCELGGIQKTRIAPSAGMDVHFAATRWLGLSASTRVHRAIGDGWRRDGSPWLTELTLGLQVLRLRL